MKVRYSHAADKQYDALSSELKKAFDKQLAFLLNDIRHPSLRAKKYDQFFFTVPGVRKMKYSLWCDQFFFTVPGVRKMKYSLWCDEATGVWQARINDSWRFCFLIANDIYFIVSIRNHPK